MGKPWTEKLAPSQVSFVNSIVEQIPENHGARASFVEMLQQLADSPTDLKYRYLIALADAGDVRGTNDKELARHYAMDDSNYVIDAQTSMWFPESDAVDDTLVSEADYPDDSEVFGGD